MNAPAPAIGFIGLGAIGKPMARQVLNASRQLVIWNRTPAKMQSLLDEGATAAATPADMAGRVDVVCVCVTDSVALEAVVFGPDGIASRPGRARLLIDNSTTHPQITRDMAARLDQVSGMHWLDAPVSGGVVGARAGTLAAMVGGTTEDVEAARPVIMSYSSHLTHMGPVGSGQATKACNQLINFIGMAAVAEAMHLAAGFGVDVEKIPEAVAGGFADMPILREYARGKAAGDTRGISALIEALIGLYGGKPASALRGHLQILRKDMGIVHDLGRKTGRVTPVFDLVESLYRIIDGAG